METFSEPGTDITSLRLTLAPEFEPVSSPGDGSPSLSYRMYWLRNGARLEGSPVPPPLFVALFPFTSSNVCYVV